MYKSIPSFVLCNNFQHVCNLWVNQLLTHNVVFSETVNSLLQISAFHLPEADCSIFGWLVDRSIDRCHVTINFTSIYTTITAFFVLVKSLVTPSQLVPPSQLSQLVPIAIDVAAHLRACPCRKFKIRYLHSLLGLDLLGYWKSTHILTYKIQILFSQRDWLKKN